jgi:hypothetical protein
MSGQLLPEAVDTDTHVALALHTSIGIASRKPPEIALLHLGTFVDRFGIRNLQVSGHERTGVMTPQKSSTLIQFAASIVLKIEGRLTYAQNMP